MQNRKFFLSTLLLAIGLMMSDFAISAPFFNTEQDGWIEIGPNNRAGRARTAFFDKFNYGVVYAGTVGGLYVSVNNGRTWQEIALGNRVEDVTAIAQDDNGTLYVGTGEGNYSVALHLEDPTGHNNNMSGRIGGGVFKQNSGVEKVWVDQFDNNTSLSYNEKIAAKFNYIKEHFSFSVLTATVPEDKYDGSDTWAYVNAMECTNGTLYVGLKNGGLKYSTDGGQTFSQASFDGNQYPTANVEDIKVNANGRIAVAYVNNGGFVALGNEGDNSNFTVVFEGDTYAQQTAEDGSTYDGAGLLRLAFGIENPNNLFVLTAIDMTSISRNSASFGSTTGYATGIFRPTDTINGINTVTKDSWRTITPSTFYIGRCLTDGMSLCVNDRGETEEVYVGGDNIYLGTDVNGTGVMKFNLQTVYSGGVADTSNSTIGMSVNNILLMRNPKNSYDSSNYILATTAAGPYMYYVDTVVHKVLWVPANKGMNTLQSYQVGAAADGSVVAAADANSIVYIASDSVNYAQGENNTIRTNGTIGGIKSANVVWSINSTNYPYWEPTQLGAGIYANNFASDSVERNNRTGSGVGVSAIYKTLPNERKPFVFARPGTNLARTYGDNGNYVAINDQTWTYGSGKDLSFMFQQLTDYYRYDPYKTPMAVWENFSYEGKDSTIAEITIKEDSSSFATIIRQNGKAEPCKAGTRVFVGDSILVQSDVSGYPFFHIFNSSDTVTLANNPEIDTCYTTEWDDPYQTRPADYLFTLKSNFKFKVPQTVQARLAVATATGVFLCPKVFDFSSTTTANKRSGLNWMKIYSSGDNVDNANLNALNNRVRDIAFSKDGNSVFLAVDNYSTYGSYSNSSVIRVDGLNDVRDTMGNTRGQASITNITLFKGLPDDTSFTTRTVLGTFPRQISSIAVNALNPNQLAVTFEGYIGTNPNVMISNNAMSSSATFSNWSISSNERKPVFSSVFECVGSANGDYSGQRLYVGSDDGVYYTTNGSDWTWDTATFPQVEVYDLWQQTAKLPVYTFTVEEGGMPTTARFESTKNTGAIYAATYGKGILANYDYLDISELDSVVSIADVEYSTNYETLKIYPNPANYQTTAVYSLSEPTNVMFRLVDMNGREISRFDAARQSEGNHQQIIDVRNLKQGVYMIQMITSNSAKTAKLIVE